MNKINTVIAVFADHEAAENAVKSLAMAGFEMKDLSVVGKGFHTEEKVVGFYTDGERIRLWGVRGVFWGGLWGVFYGGLFMSLPLIGPVVVLGYLATIAVSAAESAIIVGGAGAIAAALYGIGVPKDSVVQYENAVKNDGFLVMAHSAADETTRAKGILATTNPSQLDLHTNAQMVSQANAITLRIGDIPENKHDFKPDTLWGI
jgi:hypothetical protein